MYCFECKFCFVTFESESNLNNLFLFCLGAPTTFNLYEKLRKKWNREEEDLKNQSSFQSTYNGSFQQHDKSDLVTKHFAPRKHLSSHFHAHRINKDLPLRNTNVNIAPEIMPSV